MKQTKHHLSEKTALCNASDKNLHYAEETLHHNCFSKRSITELSQRQNLPKPFYNKILNIEQELNIELSNTYNRRPIKYPP